MEERIAIVERDDPGQVPVSVTATVEEPLPPLPVCITFRYRGHPVVCTPLYRDAGELVSLIFACPECGQRNGFRSPACIFENGSLTVHGPVICYTPGCPLRLAIHDGTVHEIPWR